MSQLQTNVSDIKTVAKNLVRELKTMNFDISHSSALNLASRSLGYKNYQTYKAVSENNEIEEDEVFADYNPNYNEEYKQEAWKVLHKETNVIKKVNAIQKIMYSHFIRSALAALNGKRNHPARFADYAPHWMYSSTKSDNIIHSQEVRDILLELYPIPKNPKIKKGESYYYE